VYKRKRNEHNKKLKKVDKKLKAILGKLPKELDVDFEVCTGSSF